MSTKSTARLYSRSNIALSAAVCNLLLTSVSALAQISPPSPPRVNAVYVDSSSWASAFKNNLAAIGVGSATLGYKIPTAYNSAMRSGVLPHQLKTSPWTNIDTIHVAFSENVQITASDFAIKGVNGSNNEVVYNGTFTYDSTTHVATWTTATAFERNKLLVIVSGEVRSVATGVKLAGGWTNPDPSVPRNGSVFPSGGSPGETFFFRTNILPGAARRGSMADTSDVFTVHDILNASTGDSTYYPFADVSGTGTVTEADRDFVFDHQGSRLPTNEPTLTMPPPNTPQSATDDLPVSTNLHLWLDAADATTLWQDAGGTSQSVNNNATVAKWDDKSGNGRNFSQSNLSLAPALTTSASHQQNGRNGILFNGSNNFIQGTHGLSAQQEISIFVVWKIIGQTSGSDKSIIIVGDRTSNVKIKFHGYPFRFASQTYGYRSPFFDYAVSPTVSLASNNKNIYVSRQSSTSHKVNLNYTSYDLPVGWNHVNITSNAMEIGRSSIHDSVTYTNLVLYELLVFGSYLSDSQTTQVIDYLDAKWAIAN